MKGQANRASESLLARREQELLRSLAGRLPANVTSDHLTVIGLVGAGLTFVAYCATNLSPWFLILASLGLFANWVGDSLDGTVARLRNKERPRYGFFVDHSSDLISQVLIGIGFGLSPFVGMSFALLLLTVYLGFAAHTFIRMNIFNTLQIAYFSVGPTEIRLLMIGANTVFLFVPAVCRPLWQTTYTIADIVCIVLAIVSFAALLLQIYIDWRVLYREETPSSSTPQRPSAHFVINETALERD